MSEIVSTPYLAVYLIFRKNNKLALLYRKHCSWMNNYYCLPCGKVEQGESVTQAACREAYEETGVLIQPQQLRHALTCHYTAPDSDWINVYFEVTAWPGTLRNTEPDKHRDLTWWDVTDLPKDMIPDVAACLRSIADGKNYLEYGF